MHAKINFEVSIELADADDYPEKVTSWEEAAEYEAGLIAFVHELGAEVTAARTINKPTIKGGKPFKRTPEEEE